MVVDLISDMADDISVLHVFGVAHGESKPENVLIFPAADRLHGLRAKVSDFGFSGSRLSEGNPRGSTPALAAPKCLSRKYRSKETQDIYSFGSVAAYVLLHRLPSMLRDIQYFEVISKDLQYLTSDYSWLDKLIEVIRGCLE